MNPRFLLAAAASLIAALSSSNSFAGDACTLFANANRGGPSYTTALGAPDEHVLQGAGGWDSASRRRIGSELSAAAMKNAASSVEIRAIDTAVYLYSFTKDAFDGKMRVFRCEKGQTCWWNNLAWIDNDIESINCQREYPKGPLDLEIPSRGFVEPLRAQVRDMGESADDVSDYDDRPTRVVWHTAWNRCVSGGSWANAGICSGPDGWREKYRDEVRLTQLFNLDLYFPGTQIPYPETNGYNVDLHMSVAPRLLNNSQFDGVVLNGLLNFQGRFAKVRVEEGEYVVTDKIYDEVYGGANDSLNDGTIGGSLFDGVSDAVYHESMKSLTSCDNPTAACQNKWNNPQTQQMARGLQRAVLAGNRRVQLSFACAAQNGPGTFNELAGYAAQNLNNPCDSQMDVEAYPPTIRVQK